MQARISYLYPQRHAEIFCVYCGVELRQKGAYKCEDCGRALCEICEIDFVPVLHEDYEVVFFDRVYKGRYSTEIPRLKFWAKVIEGPYVSAGIPCNVGESPGLEGAKDGPQCDNQEHINAVNDLVRKLREDGWEQIASSGLQWYSYRFRRRVW